LLIMVLNDWGTHKKYPLSIVEFLSMGLFIPWFISL